MRVKELLGECSAEQDVDILAVDKRTGEYRSVFGDSMFTAQELLESEDRVVLTIINSVLESFESISATCDGDGDDYEDGDVREEGILRIYLKHDMGADIAEVMSGGQVLKVRDIVSRCFPDFAVLIEEESAFETHDVLGSVYTVVRRVAPGDKFRANDPYLDMSVAHIGISVDEGNTGNTGEGDRKDMEGPLKCLELVLAQRSEKEAVIYED